MRRFACILSAWTTTQRIVNKAWSYAHLLRDDGLSYLSYTEQITFLLFLLFLKNPADCHDRRLTWSGQTPDGRWRAYDYEDLLKRDKVNLDLFWLRDESLGDAAGLPEPDVIAEEIAEDLQSALDQFAAIANDLRRDR